MKSTSNVCVIGAGINGLSCAILLQKAGFSVTIISKDDPQTVNSNPVYASYFPSASIIPHSVYTDELIPLFKESLHHFKNLHDKGFKGLGINEHYELFSFQKEIPEYAQLISNFTEFKNFKNRWFPQHPSIKVQSGWKFDCFFADWSIYFPALLEEFSANGGIIEISDLNLDAIEKLPCEIVINCSGAGASKLFEQNKPIVYRGHLVHIFDTPLLNNPSNNTVSYNFSPEQQTADVYCYPRKDGWILGGSRQKGTLDDSGVWKGEKSIESTEMINGTEAPARILHLNREIIVHTFGIDLNQFQKKAVKMGYRYIRSTDNGLRLEKDVLGDKLIIHNYGHGGAGVTLSWGCALKVISLLEEEVSSAL